MSTPLRCMAVAAALAFLMPAAAAAQKTSYDYDRSTNFAELTTFGFKEGTKSDNPLVDERITTAIARTLMSRGLRRDDFNPDLIIVTHLTFDKEKDVTAYSTSPWYGGYGWYWGGGWGTDVRVREILMGKLVIDMVDARKGALVWRGIGVKEVKQHRKPSSVDKNVNEVVSEILEKFPPRQSS